MRRFRLLLGLVVGAAAVAVAIAAGGWLPIMLGLIAVLITIDALVADSYMPLFSRELPESKRQRLRGRRGAQPRS